MFRDALFRANRTYKANIDSFNAFQSPNYPKLGSSGISFNLDLDLVRPHPKFSPKVVSSLFTNINVSWLIPGFSDESLETMLLDESPKAIVLALYGSGNAPDRIRNMISKISANGHPVVLTSQSRTGRIMPGLYEAGNFGDNVISGGDMTLEATTTKLSYLMGKGYTGAELKTMMETNLRGEISENASK